MKICYLADGESVHTHRWCRYFKDLGHEIHLITFRNVSIEGVHVYFIDAGNIERSGGNWKIVLKYCKVRSLIRSIRPDILHAHYATSYGLVGALSHYHPFVISALGSDILISPFQSRLYKCVVKYALKKADWITSMAEHMTAKLVSLGVKKEKISEVIFGIDEKIYNSNSRKLEKDSFVIVSTRSFEPVYNFPLLFNSIKLIKEKIPGLKVKLIGNGTFREEYEQMVNDLNINGYIEFMGTIPQSELIETLKSSHLFISVSLSDGNSVSLIEAMACGALPIVSDIPANTQWIKDGLNGFIVPVNNEELLAEKILFAYHNFANMEKQYLEINDQIIQDKGLWRKNMEVVQKKYEMLVKEFKN